MDWHWAQVNNVDSTANQATHNTTTLHFQAWWNLCNIVAPRVLAVSSSPCDISEGVRSSSLCVGFIFHDSITKRGHMVIQTGPALKSPPSQRWWSDLMKQQTVCCLETEWERSSDGCGQWQQQQQLSPAPWAPQDTQRTGQPTTQDKARCSQ